MYVDVRGSGVANNVRFNCNRPTVCQFRRQTLQAMIHCLQCLAAKLVSKLAKLCFVSTAIDAELIQLSVDFEITGVNAFHGHLK